MLVSVSAASIQCARASLNTCQRCTCGRGSGRDSSNGLIMRSTPGRVLQESRKICWRKWDNMEWFIFYYQIVRIMSERVDWWAMDRHTLRPVIVDCTMHWLLQSCIHISLSRALTIFWLFCPFLYTVMM